jgi:hypothetical protein
MKLSTSHESWESELRANPSWTVSSVISIFRTLLTANLAGFKFRTPASNIISIRIPRCVVGFDGLDAFRKAFRRDLDDALL